MCTYIQDSYCFGSPQKSNIIKMSKKRRNMRYVLFHLHVGSCSKYMTSLDVTAAILMFQNNETVANQSSGSSTLSLCKCFLLFQ